MPESMTQLAPYPDLLAALVDQLAYKRGWRFALVDGYDRGQGSIGLTLIIGIVAPDSSDQDRTICVDHLMPVPPAAYEERSWRDWLFDQILLVEQHEAAEFFMLGNDKPYAPLHQPGSNPYMRVEKATDVELRTSFRGVVGD
jgi:hypothetical protein